MTLYSGVTITFSLCFLACISSGYCLHQGINQRWWNERPRPYFTSTSPSNLTVLSGQTAYLPCRVHMLGERSVTWMRGRDLHILTVGVLTYSADERFQVIHSPETDDWTLQVRETKPWDTGTYKCQVNSHPKIFRDVHLNVMDKGQLDHRLYKMPTADSDQGEYGTVLVGGSERYIQAGSSLVVECVVTHTSDPPPALFWYYQQRLLDYDHPRGGIAIMVEKTNEQTTSRLLLSTVKVSDSGNYTCVPVNAPTASVSVHVTTDELRAAVQQGGYSSGNSSACIHYDLLPRRPITILISSVNVFLTIARSFPFL
ncbi:immunoglobulin superfamily DCC subclass member 3-like [Macrobrachium nipponense]|uniref:immunoglobulin superfamily DCC subclass member 3-like n=1 Tax=Macrobrachium nipponense TaxID=159736 RepID=UPI0030C7EA89